MPPLWHQTVNKGQQDVRAIQVSEGRSENLLMFIFVALMAVTLRRTLVRQLIVLRGRTVLMRAGLGRHRRCAGSPGIPLFDPALPVP